jgi:hypothetical protein
VADRSSVGGGTSKIRRPLRMLGVIGFAVGVLAVAASPSALASNPPLSTAAWQQAVAQPQNLGAGCYQVAYPSLSWQAAPCAVAPNVPLAPAATQGAPHMAVGDGKDYSAVVSGTVSTATGSFTDVSPTITEKGTYGGTGPKLATTYSLQLNSQFFKGSPACAPSPDATCLAWQQFVYSSYTNEVFMQYWLITYATTCPPGWFTYSPDCYTNSSATTFPTGRITAPDLASTKLTATAAKGGTDGVALSFGGHAVLVKKADTEVHLATHWNTAEFNVFGDGGGTVADFGTKTTLEAQTSVTDGSTAAPACVDEGFTAETNNLNLTATTAIGTQASPTIVFRQTNQKAASPSCAVAAGSSTGGRPQKPTPPNATAANKSATLTWSADATGGSVITSYTVTSTPGKKSCTWTTGPLTCTVKGLTNGTPYTFTLVAKNANGKSPRSSPSNQVTPSTTPARPLAPQATAGDASAVVTWAAVATGGSPITRYVVTSATGDHSCTWTAGSLSCTVGTLTNGHAYKFRVVAHNARGTGVPSPYSKAVKPRA